MHLWMCLCKYECVCVCVCVYLYTWVLFVCVCLYVYQFVCACLCKCESMSVSCIWAADWDVFECVHGGGGYALYFSGEAWEPHSCQQPGLVGYTESPMSGCLRARVCKWAVCLDACIFILIFNSLIFKYVYSINIADFVWITKYLKNKGLLSVLLPKTWAYLKNSQFIKNFFWDKFIFFLDKIRKRLLWADWCCGNDVCLLQTLTCYL